MDVITPTNFRKDIFKVLKNIIKNKKPIEITVNSKSEFNDGVVVMDKDEYEKLKELEYLEETGTLDIVLKRMENSKKDDFKEL